MNLILQPYTKSLENIPQSGQHILAQQTDELIVVYQAYKPAIAKFAVANQVFGGPDYSFNRMSWIKPNFLWMMYRCGWAEKENQERVLAIWIDKKYFERILAQSAFSSFQPSHHKSHDDWRQELTDTEVRLQWDPDHDPYGKKLERRAIQLGLKGNALKDLNNHIKHIEDITSFVIEQKQLLDAGHLNKLLVPVEKVFRPADEELNKRIGIE
jgi:hypothetical protein